MKFLHSADIHLDSPLLGLDRYDGAPVDELRGATRRAFRSLVDSAIELAVDFVLIAGDIHDGPWRDFNTGLWFVRELGRLKEAGIRVAMVRGNHDAEGEITKNLKLPDNALFLDSRRCQTIRWDDLGVAVHGRSFATGFVSDDLAATYPAAASGWFNIGLLHTSLTGRPGHANYAPTTLDVLRSKGYDYWALGHVHAREVVVESPRIAFPGNLQGRHARETGPKGCELVTVEGSDISAEPLVLDAARWMQLGIDATALEDLDALLDRVHVHLEAATAEAGDRILAARLNITGSAALYERLVPRFDEMEAELRALGTRFGSGVWIEKIRFAPQPRLDRAAALQRQDAIGEVLRLVDRLGTSEDEFMALAREAAGDLASKLPVGLLQGEEGLRLSDPEFLAPFLAEAEGLLLSRFQGEA